MYYIRPISIYLSEYNRNIFYLCVPRNCFFTFHRIIAPKKTFKTQCHPSYCHKFVQNDTTLFSRNVYMKRASDATTIILLSLIRFPDTLLFCCLANLASTSWSEGTTGGTFTQLVNFVKYPWLSNGRQSAMQILPVISETAEIGFR